jgi:hypothetical protein
VHAALQKAAPEATAAHPAAEYNMAEFHPWNSLFHKRIPTQK